MRAFFYKLLSQNQAFTSMLSSGKTLKITTQLYSGHDNGWTKKDFHNRCDNKQRTVSLF
jgi:hypothetical protein